MAAFPSEIFFDNDFNVNAGEVGAPLQTRASTTGVVTNFAGQTITCFISTTKDATATAIHADLSITLTEDGSNPGVYWGGFSGDKITLRLAGLVDTKVYVIFRSGQNYRRVEEVMVRDPRSGA